MSKGPEVSEHSYPFADPVLSILFRAVLISDFFLRASFSVLAADWPLISEQWAHPAHHWVGIGGFGVQCGRLLVFFPSYM